MNRKLTAEDLLAQKIKARDKYLEKRNNSLKLMENYKGYAEKAEEEYLKRAKQVELMEARLEGYRKAQEELLLVTAKLEELEKVTPKYMRMKPNDAVPREEDYFFVADHRDELKKYIEETTGVIARINNGTEGA